MYHNISLLNLVTVMIKTLNNNGLLPPEVAQVVQSW
jgi:hypothetical protein